MHKAYVDGGCRPNPGRGAYGFILYDDRGREIKRQNGSAGENVTNNIAEYTAVLEVLKAAKSMSIEHLVVFSDSQIIIKQLNGDYNVYEPRLQTLHREAMDLINAFEKVVFVYIRRSQNRLADALTNQYFGKMAEAGQQ